MKKLSIRLKLIIGFSIVVLLTLVVGGTGYFGQEMIVHENNIIPQKIMPYVQNVNKIKGGIRGVLIGQRALMIKELYDGDMSQVQYNYLGKSIEDVNVGVQELNKLELNDQEQKDYNELLELYSKWEKINTKFLELCKKRQDNKLSKTGLEKLNNQIQESGAQSRLVFLDIDNLMNRTIAIQEKSFDKTIEKLDRHEKNVTMTLAILVIVIAILSIVLVQVIVKNIGNMLKTLVTEVSGLIKSAEKGELKKRANVEAVASEFRSIPSGINSVLDVMNAPIKVTTDYLKMIGKGIIPEKITDEYHGDFNDIKNSLNECIDGLDGLVEANSVLQLMAKNDYTKTMEGNYQGVYEEVKKSVNYVIQGNSYIVDALNRMAIGDLSDLKILQDYGRQCDNDNMVPALIAIVSSLGEITNNAKRIADGDLTVSLKIRSDKDELMMALSEMIEKLNEVVGQILESSHNVSSGSMQLSNVSIQVSQGASEQAASTEEISSSVEEMDSTIQQNTANAVDAGAKAKDNAVAIVDVNASAMETLKAIEMIADKINVINSIAEKTDILAINAAIEAARAGEQGKGFAVVAAEVRKLAETSQQAAIEINGLSEKSLSVTSKAGSLMANIIPDIQKSSDLVNEIAMASKEQSVVSEQIAKAVEQLSQVTQQNSASAEEMSSTAEELNSQAESLSDVIQYFKVKNNSFLTKKNNSKNNKLFADNFPGEDSLQEKRPLKINLDKDDDYDNF